MSIMQILNKINKNRNKSLDEIIEEKVNNLFKHKQIEFYYTGANQTFTVPENVTKIYITACAGGGAGTGHSSAYTLVQSESTRVGNLLLAGGSAGSQGGRAGNDNAGNFGETSKYVRIMQYEKLSSNATENEEYQNFYGGCSLGIGGGKYGDVSHYGINMGAYITNIGTSFPACNSFPKNSAGIVQASYARASFGGGASAILKKDKGGGGGACVKDYEMSVTPSQNLNIYVGQGGYLAIIPLITSIGGTGIVIIRY